MYSCQKSMHENVLERALMRELGTWGNMSEKISLLQPKQLPGNIISN